MIQQASTKIALAQFGSVINDKKSNFEKSCHYMSMAAKQGAEIILFPEMFLIGYAPESTDMLPMAETIDGESIQNLRSAAVKNNIAVVGSFLERDTDKGCNYNTSVFISAQGELLGTFRKIHLFDSEREIITAGEKAVTVNYKGICYGLLICFDIEFPELARRLAVNKAQVLLAVSANMKPYGPFHRNYALARAQENHVFVGYCNQVGSNGVWDFVGESCLVNPSGEIICELAGEEGMVVGSVQLSDIDRSKEVYNYLNERRLFFD